MKKRSLLAMTLVGTALLTACGTTEGNNDTEKSPEETPMVEAFTGTAVRSVKGDGETTQIEVTFDNGKPTNVEIDIVTDDGISKHEISSKGEYVMVEGEAMAWHEQIDALESHLVDVEFDFSKIATIDEAGHIDAVSGVSISVGSYLTETEALINEVVSGTYVAPEQQ